MLRVLDLFSGIGGFSLGLQRTGGFKTVAFCEIEPFPRKVLAKHWPEVPCYHDIRELTAARLAADGIGVDVICGGFPCQDISVAGKGAGIKAARSGLWSEFARLIGELRPQYVIVENVSALLSRGLADVLGDLAEIGYDAEWHCIPASAVGAPHRRDRIWIVAHPSSTGICEFSKSQNIQYSEWSNSETEFQRDNESLGAAAVRFNEPVADASKLLSNGGELHCGSNSESTVSLPQFGNMRSASADADISRLEGWCLSQRIRSALTAVDSDGWWSVEPDICRVAHGVPSRVDRLKGLGNAVVPAIPEMIGREILAAQAEA